MATLSALPAPASLSGFEVVKRSNFRAQLPSLPTRKSPKKMILTTISSFRFANVESSKWRHMRLRLAPIFASKTNPADEDSLKEKAGSGDQGPPLATIVAGVVVFIFILWIVGSILMWLIGLIVNVPPQR